MLLELELELVAVEAAGIRFLLQKYGDRFYHSVQLQSVSRILMVFGSLYIVHNHFRTEDLLQSIHIYLCSDLSISYIFTTVYTLTMLKLI